MAEAEDVITDAVRHASIYARALWLRHRPPTAGPAVVRLTDLAQRLNLLLAAVFGRSFVLRVAQEPPPPLWLARLLQRYPLPAKRQALAATDGQSIWLPASLVANDDVAAASERFRLLALQQAVRIERGSAAACAAIHDSLLRALYQVLEAQASDAALLQLLPGMQEALGRLRRDALQSRPPLSDFARPVQAFEQWLRRRLQTPVDTPLPPTQLLAQAQALRPAFETKASSKTRGMQWLWCDLWTAELREPPSVGAHSSAASSDETDDADASRPRSVRLLRRPELREEKEDEDDAQPGAWMVQTAQPHEQVEDPMGLQRPTDRETATAAEDYADALSELPEARLVSAPGKPKEVFLSDDPPTPARRMQAGAGEHATASLQYPEWDWRRHAYRNPGANVLLLPAVTGSQQWVDDTLEQQRGMLHEIRRLFTLLRSQRTRLRKQLDGNEIDLSAYIEARADFQAGLPLAQRLYQSERRSRRDMAIMLLVDVSGSTDGWIAHNRRIIDVEREALLLVCIALEGLAEPYSVLAFSGEGPEAVTVRSIKRFDEPYDNTVARRIAGLEPENYTRAGAAIRHASSLLLRENAGHRLLLLLSDGKPNDVDDYEGRYGVEDMRQAVIEAKLQGLAPFCLTIDRQAANYLPAVFGPQHYALLPRPELLPTVLLDWLRRLVTH